ncbi:MAG: hypothetical protein AMJ56_17320 [Anaerolineae bacterium SG8_19]|nr:MAG: hypothetical protein AMJ56_17320 [Anaerolineae bacterium SG8_19]
MSVDMQIIVANFDTEDGAKDALKAVKHEKVNRGDVAILSKNEKGKIRVKETDDWGGGKGAVASCRDNRRRNHRRRRSQAPRWRLPQR